MTGGASALAGLTPREREIAVAASSGAPAQELAAQLFLSPRTVETHLIRIYRKLGLRSRAELVALVLGDKQADGEPVVALTGGSSAERDVLAIPAQSPRASGGRRKMVTLLQCVVSDVESLEESLDAEVLGQLVDAFCRTCRQVVERHQGEIETTIGGAVLAVFGVTTAREDDALRAVRAAADLHAAVHELSEDAHSRYGVRLRLRVGINSGEVIVGAGNPGGRLAAGSTLNGALRLAESAGAGETAIGDLTRELVGASATTTRAPFVGRRQEMAVLDEALLRVIDTQTAALITIVGDAGLGKSRLVTEFVAGLTPRAKVLSGRCLSYGDGIAFWPVVEILRAACDLDGSEGPDVVEARLGRLVVGQPDATAMLAQLRPLLVANGEPGSTGDVIRAVVSTIENIAVRGPVVVCVDDVHWAEPVLLELIDALLQCCRDLPILTIVQARPEFLSAHPTWASATVNTTTLRLEPLPAIDADALVSSIGDLAESVAVRVVTAAGGNPLYLEQLAAHAANIGLDGRVEVPPTLAALLAARLDQLDEHDRGLVSDAAVIGQAFRVDELTALVGAEADDVRDRLEKLSERQIVRRDRGRRGGFRFQHVLVQQAAYDAQPKAMRARKHREYASWLAKHPEEAGGELSALRGWHLEQAYLLLSELAPRDASVRTVAQSAAEALADASRAREGADPTSAVNLLRRAVALTQDKRTKLRRILRLAYLEMLFTFAMNDVPGTLAEAACLAVGGRAEQALLDQLRRCHLQMADTRAKSPDDGRIGDRSRQAASEADWHWARAASARLSVMELQAVGAWSKMLPVIDESISWAASSGERHMRNEALRFRATIVRWGPTRVKQAIPMLSETLVMLKDEPEERGRVEMELAVLFALDGNAELARATLPAEPLSTDTASYLHWAFCRGAIEEALADNATAAAVAHTAAHLLAAQGDVAYSSTLYGWSAILFALVADLDQARSAAEVARRTSPDGDSVSQASWRLATALIAAHDGDVTTVERMVHDALPYVEVDETLQGKGDFYRYAATAMHRIGRQSECADLAAAALELYRRKGTTVYEARCQQLVV